MKSSLSISKFNEQLEEKKLEKDLLLTFSKVPSLKATQAANTDSTSHQFERHSKISCKQSPPEILFNGCFHQNLRRYWPARARIVKHQLPHCSQDSTVAIAQEAKNGEDSCLKTKRQRIATCVHHRLIRRESAETVSRMETGHTGSWKAKETSDEKEKRNKWKGTERPTQQTREMITAAGLRMHADRMCSMRLQK